MEAKTHGTYFFFLLLALVAVLCILIFRPFLTVIVLGASFAVVLHPLFSWIHSHVLRKRAAALASFLTVIIFILVLAIPLFLIGARVFAEAGLLYTSIGGGGAAREATENITAFITEAFPQAASFDIQSKLDNVFSFVAGTFTSIFASTLHTLFSVLLMLLAIFYFLKDGRRWKSYLTDLSPLSDKHDERILTMLTKAVNGVMLGYILVALAQGLFLGIGLLIFGIPNAALWGVLAGIASMIPTIGTALVSVPAVLYLFITGDTAQAVGLAIWSAALVGMIDNFLSPVVVGKRIQLPPLLVLFGVLGGISLMGISGVVIGPLAVSLLFTLTAIYKEDFKIR